MRILGNPERKLEGVSDRAAMAPHMAAA